MGISDRNGKPVIRGTRIPVTVILEQIAEGDSWDSILTGYPELTKEDIYNSYGKLASWQAGKRT